MSRNRVPAKHNIHSVVSAIYHGPFWDKLHNIGIKNPDLLDSIQGVTQAAYTGLAPNTVKAYNRWLKQFQQFCTKVHTDWTEATHPEVAIFLQSLVHRGLAGTSVAQASAAISWAMQVADIEDRTKHRMVQHVIQAARRIPRNIKRAEPTEVEHLEWIKHWADNARTFASQRTFTLSLALFFTCSRLSDLRSLPRGAVFMDDSCIEFHTGRMKNNQYQRDVHFKHMFPSKNPELCPVRHFKAWLQHPQCIQEAAAPIFQSTNDKWKPVTESCFTDNLKAAQKASRLPRITGHSHRAGFATLGDSLLRL